MPRVQSLLRRIKSNRYIHQWCPKLIAEINHIIVRYKLLRGIKAVLIRLPFLTLLIVDSRLKGLANCEAIGHELWHFFSDDGFMGTQIDLFSSTEIYAQFFAMALLRFAVNSGREECKQCEFAKQKREKINDEIDRIIDTLDHRRVRPTSKGG